MTLSCTDYFAGIGGWEVAIAIVNQFYGYEVFQTKAFIEILPEAQHFLRSHYPSVPIYSDIRLYNPFYTDVKIVSFPCTGTSQAGKRLGLKDPESCLWFEALRCIKIGRPRFVVIEQPEGFVIRGLRECIANLRMAGYKEEIEIISAAGLGAPHRRKRVFVVATNTDYPINQRWEQQIGTDIEDLKAFATRSQDISRGNSLDDGVLPWISGISYSGFWRNPPITCGVPLRQPGRRELINLLGRTVVPLQAAIPLMRIKYLAAL
jgi:DNA (cytosine-5)-methyltransferase 1